MQETDNDQWTVDATEALEVSLVRLGSNGLETIASFNPKLTYALFEDERIFGYQDLKIKLQYNVSDMRPHLSISSKKKFTPVGDVEAVDVKAIMKDFLPNAALMSKPEFTDFIKKLPETWTPPGQLIKSCPKNGAVYEVWHGSLADPAVRQLVKRVQISVLFFIEGGSYIGEDVEGNDHSEEILSRWSVYFLYKKEAISEGKPQYIFQGYSTVYNFWLYQQPTPPSSPPSEAEASIEACSQNETSLPLSKMPHRARISQFIILPPFQGMGGGALLYDTIFARHMEDSFTKEVTVEDPNEEFDLLRDLCDMKWLRKNVPDFVDLSVNPGVAVPQKGGILRHNTQVSLSENDEVSDADGIVNVAALEKMRKDAKIAPRQFSRLVEMHLMHKLPATVRPSHGLETAEGGSGKSAASLADKQAYTRWRLLLKQRIYRRNANILGEFDTTERIIKLNETLENVEWEYARILERLDNTPSTKKAAEAVLPLGTGKRKHDDDEDDVDDGDVPTASKRPKASDVA